MLLHGSFPKPLKVSQALQSFRGDSYVEWLEGSAAVVIVHVRINHWFCNRCNLGDAAELELGIYFSRPILNNVYRVSR